MRIWLIALAVLALAAGSLAAGRDWASPAQVVSAVLGGPDGAGGMIWALRMPRLICGLVAGAALGVSGLVFQSLLRNPLASPDVIGVTQAAALGAVLALGAQAPVMGGALLGGLCGIGCLVAMAARRHHPPEPRALVLLGLGVAMFSAALTEALLLRASDNTAASMMTWLAGSLNGTGWTEAGLALWLGLGILPLCGAVRVLDRLELGDDLAFALGINVRRWRGGLALWAALLAAGAVALAGPMGFVALASGPVARWATGGRPNPAVAGLVGAGFVTLADLLSRAFAGGALLPAGLYTALIGAPVLIFAVWRQNRA